MGGARSDACVLMASPAPARPGPAPGREAPSARARRRRRQLFLSRPPAAALSASGRAVERLCACRVALVSVAAEKEARAAAEAGERAAAVRASAAPRAQRAAT